MQKKWIALIPAYEPDEHLLRLLCQTRQMGIEAVVVDDGSGNDFWDIFQQAGKFADVLTHSENKGKGAALKTGLAYIQKQFHRDFIIITMDVDGQHSICDARKICETAQQNPDCLVLGSRRLSGGIPLRSWLGNTLTRLIYRCSTGQRIYDTQSGFRAFSDRLLPKFINVAGERYEYEMNVLLKCSQRQIPVLEIPIKTIYIDNNAASHFDTWRDSYRIFREILKFSASSLISFLVDYTLYSFFLLVTAGLGATVGLWVSNSFARVISASVNYTINRTVVFQSTASSAKTALQYFVLAAVILLGNTLLLSLMVEQLAMNRYAAKILTEVLFFFFSWLIQRCIIFRKRVRT